MKKPLKATLLLERNRTYPIVQIHFKSGQVTLEEKANLFNTVSIKNVEFDFSGFSVKEKREFLNAFQK